ncbi:MAG TPA: hypothetical protein VKV32_08485 [Stellaceae bacterium]|nr:hypothetical protein [Stellaceae bacterium]
MADSVGMGAPITPASAVDHRIYAGNAVTPAQARGDQGANRSAPSEEPTQLALGTVIEAVVRMPAGNGPSAGTQLLLRIVAPIAQATDLVTGTVVDAAGNETLVATPIGLLALQRRLALPPGTAIAFVVIDTVVPAADTALAPARSGGWLALEEALFALLSASPAQADQLRAELTPQSGPELAGTLLFFLGALYRGNWPGPAMTAALNEAGQAKLAKRLGEDVAALRRLGEDQTTGEWQVLTLPLLLGNFPLAIRLYLQRRRASAKEGIRFAIEAELSRLGPIQLDCLLRDNRLILVLRSHRALSPELRQEMRDVFRRAIARSGLSGDLSFATAATFLVSPLDRMRGHIKITA